MAVDRLDVRLDKDMRRKLKEMTQHRGTSTSALVREAIDRLYEEDLLQRRIEAVERLASMEIEVMPDPEELSRQLDSTYDTPLP
jgi:predicted DNA-binding protein